MNILNQWADLLMAIMTLADSMFRCVFSWTCLFLSFTSIFLKFIYLCIYLCIYLFIAELGLRCCARAFSSCGERGLLFVEVCRLLTAVHKHFLVKEGLATVQLCIGESLVTLAKTEVRPSGYWLEPLPV